MTTKYFWEDVCKMNDTECGAIKDFINARVNMAILKLKNSNARYREVYEKQEDNWQEVDTILQKLESDDRSAVLRHYEEEVHKFGFEFNETYLQGVKDCFGLLAFFGVLGGGCMKRTPTE
jgi:hypothetical protein